MGMWKGEEEGGFRLNLWPRCWFGIGVCSFFFLVACGSDEESSRAARSSTFSSSKPVGFTALSHGGPGPSNQKGIASEDPRIGQRVIMRSPAGHEEQTPLPFLPALPGMLGSEVPFDGRGEPTVLSGTMVTVIEVATDPSYRMTQESKPPVDSKVVYIKVQRKDGVQGWVPSDYLAFQEITKRE